MKNRRLALRYARALFQHALERNEVEALGEELQQLVSLIREMEEMQEFLDHPRIPTSQKKSVVSDLFAEQVRPVLVEFLYLLIEKRRTPLLETIGEEYHRLWDEWQGIVRAEMTAAIPLTGEDIARYRKRLEDIIGKRVVLTFRHDPSLVAGAVFRVGDRLIDASVRSYLRALRDQLKRVRVT